MLRFLIDLLRFAFSAPSRGGAASRQRGRGSGSLSVVSTSWFCPSGRSPSSFNSVEIHPSTLTLFNNKNGCPTSPGTGTLRRQAPKFHPLNPLKTVPSLGHFSHKISQLPSLIHLNVVKFLAKVASKSPLIFNL